VPVVAAARMSLSLPVLIEAVPLYCPPIAGEPGDQPLTQWFSDGGITSNFPIHFFDTLLPRWPTFGLNLQDYDAKLRPEPVLLPEQDAAVTAESWTDVVAAGGFVNAILNTFEDWRDTMQAGLPGFRGRIAHVRQRKTEGGTNLFMRRATIRALADRGQTAGIMLRERFTGRDGTVPDVDGRTQTQTDRYRFIRMRIALSKYGDMMHEIHAGARIYEGIARDYRIPAQLGPWFEPPRNIYPLADPTGGRVADAIAALGRLAGPGGILDEKLEGSPRVTPDLRLTPRE
jgi:hypothetical protein